MESESFRAVPYWEVLLQGTRVRERTSETKKEGKPNQGSVTKLEPLWKNRLFNPKEAYSEQYEIHFRRNVFSLAPIPVGQQFAPQGITLLHFWVRFPWCLLLCHQKRSPRMGGKRQNSGNGALGVIVRRANLISTPRSWDRCITAVEETA